MFQWWYREVPGILRPTSLQVTSYVTTSCVWCVCVCVCVCSSVSFITSRVACCFRFDQWGKPTSWSGSEGPWESGHRGSDRPHRHQGLLQESSPGPPRKPDALLFLPACWGSHPCRWHLTWSRDSLEGPLKVIFKCQLSCKGVDTHWGLNACLLMAEDPQRLTW